MMIQQEITERQQLLDKNGHIAHPGFARKLYWQYDRSHIKAPKWRIKEWDYYLVTNDSYGVAFTISDLGYIGLVSVSFLNFTEGWEHTETVITPLPMGKFALSADSSDGNAEFRQGTSIQRGTRFQRGTMSLRGTRFLGKRVRLQYSTSDNKRIIRCRFYDFHNGKDFSAQIHLEQPEMDTMCIATPFKEKPTAFYYNQKIACMPAKGKICLGDDVYYFTPDKDFGVLDWGRGVWTYDNTWYWAIGNYRINGEPFGFNLGYGFSDRSSASENVLFYKGKVHKLEEVIFHIPKKSNGSDDLLKPWKITSSDNRLTGIFTPVLDRNANMNFLVITSIQHQVFGYFNGTAVLDDGTHLTVENMFCGIEKVRNKY